ncbi:MAG: hypothetical protein HY852_15305 [Bradyrhizobium sp.]|uniref:hypothetical protein n=1 Tax=Bradyrhizobium sp. TaxID=376 RepID=UPI0025BBA4B8|nr:hypothetical protein [Bradyrhizobium sp.]MBI5263176.1 hypothetical protein [Bradyrhizobium sp.]
MALHRDIFRVGRQWAVTGFGLQAIDQRLKGVIDIKIAELWDDELIARRRAMPGLNVQDFEKALAIGRERFPQSPGSIAVTPDPAPMAVSEATVATTSQPTPTLRTEGRLARLAPRWRIRR